MSGANLDFVLHPLPAQGGYRPRDEMEDLRKWWQDGPSGVCVLVGAIGSGKSMLAGQFLHELGKNRLPSETPVVDRPRFICSFEGNVAADTCAAALVGWLAKDRQRDSAQLSLELLRKSLREISHPVLIVLDGVEQVLSPPPLYPEMEYGSGAPGLLDQVLANAVTGHFPQVAWLVTGRFPPDRARSAALDNHDFGDLHEASYLLGGRSDLYRPILIDRLPIESCIDLLRNGCRLQASTPELQALAERCGRHPQMVALVGAYLSAFASGDLSQATLAWLFDPPVAEKSIPRGLQEARHIFQRRGERVRKIVESFREQLRRQDPASLAILERLSLFLFPPTADLLERIFLGVDKGAVSGKHLKMLDASGLNRRIEYLRELQLIERRDRPDNQPSRYSVHAGIRTLLCAGMNTNQRYHSHSAIAEAMSKRNKKIIVPESTVHGLREGFRTETTYYWSEHATGLAVPTKYVDGDALVERIHHLVISGRVSDAFRLVEELRHVVDVFDSAGRLLTAIQAFFPDIKPYNVRLPHDDLETDQIARLVFLWGACKRFRGDLQEAKCAFRRAWSLTSTDKAKQASDGLRERLVRHYSALLEELGELATLHGFITKVVGVPKITGKDVTDEAWVRTLVFQGKVKEVLRWFPETKHRLIIARRCRRWLGLPELMTLPEYIEARGGLSPANESRCPGETMEDQWIIHNHPLVDLPIERWLEAGTKLLTEAREKDHLAKCTAQVEVCRIWFEWLKVAALESRGADWNVTIGRSRFEGHFGEGMKLVQQAGYSIYHSDLLSLKARVLLLSDSLADVREARLAALTGLFGRRTVDAGDDPYSAEPRKESDPREGRGVFPPPESGLPRIVAVTHPDCGYFWSELEHRQILVEADLLEAAMTLGTNKFDPVTTQGGEVDRLLASGKEQLKRLVKMHEDVDAQRPKVHPPDPDLARVREMLTNLESGTLPEPLFGFTEGTNEYAEWFSSENKQAAELFVSEPRLRLAYQSWLEIVGISVFARSKWQELVDLEQWQARFPNLKPCPRLFHRFFRQPAPTLSLHQITKGDFDFAWHAIAFRHDRFKNGVYHSEGVTSQGQPYEIPDRLTWKKYLREARTRMKTEAADPIQS